MSPIVGSIQLNFTFSIKSATGVILDPNAFKTGFLTLISWWTRNPRVLVFGFYPSNFVLYSNGQPLALVKWVLCFQFIAKVFQPFLWRVCHGHLKHPSNGHDIFPLERHRYNLMCGGNLDTEVRCRCKPIQDVGITFQDRLFCVLPNTPPWSMVPWSMTETAVWTQFWDQIEIRDEHMYNIKFAPISLVF